VTPHERATRATAHIAKSADPLGPLVTRTAGQQVADRIVTALALGQFAVGERLPTERELAATLRVSRTTVRQGVALLVAWGYVSVRRGQGGGIFVESSWLADAPAIIHRTLLPDWARLEHLFDYRSIVEAEIARVAARRRTQKNIDTLRTALDEYIASPPERASSRAADVRLHQCIAAATGNPYLVELSLRIRHDVGFGMGVEPWSPALRQRGLHQHPGLVEAIIAGDEELASTLATEHFSLTELTIRDIFAHVAAQLPPDQPLHSPRGDHGHT
jgi:GntR family transcriptional regulator, transcriptional repressor for pyruvate dehydrogenase complex